MDRVKKCMVMVIRILGVCVLCVLLAGGLLLFGEKEVTQTARVLFAGTQEDADCAILLSLDTCVVIDTGEEQDAEHILELLEKEGVEQIDCLILTHPAQEHIGGAHTLIESMSVQMIVVPYYGEQKDNYDMLLADAKELGISILTPARSRELNYGELSFRIWPPQETYYEKDNDYSLAVLVRHGDVEMFFAGDAQKKRMEEISTYNLPQVDLYKVSCHGRNLTAGAQFIEEICPQYAIVTSVAPEREIEQPLLSVGAQIVCTGKKDALFVSDGKTIKIGLKSDNIAGRSLME